MNTFERNCQLYGEGKITTKEFERRTKTKASAPHSHKKSIREWSQLLGMRSARLGQLLTLDVPCEIVEKEIELIEQALWGVKRALSAKAK